ncbi:MAG: hypothetical protein ACPGJM_04725, partial [Paracoccaceae bacterium]
IKPRDFKSLVSTIPPRGQEPDFQTCRYFKFQPPNSIRFTSIGCFFNPGLSTFPRIIPQRTTVFYRAKRCHLLRFEDDQLIRVAIKVTARGKVPFMLEMTINAAKPLK